jgi:anti-anti-sigma factor
MTDATGIPTWIYDIINNYDIDILSGGKKMSDDFAVTKLEEKDGVVKFVVKGHVNSINAPRLEDKLEDTLKAGHTDIVLEMSRVEYLSSIGIRVILKIYKKAEAAGGKFRIERPSEIVRNVLGISALNDMMLVD